MDLSLTDEQQAAATLASTILGDACTLPHLKALEDEQRFDRALWVALADADLVGLSLPESLGGGGFGLMETCLLLREVGRHVAPVPLRAVALLGAFPITAWATTEQQARWLDGVASGAAVLTGALDDEGSLDPFAPATSAAADGDGWRLTGVKTAVPFGAHADRIVVAATAADGPGLWVVEAGAAGVAIEPQRTIDLVPAARLTLEAAPAERIDGASLAGAVAVASVGLCATAAGTAQAALGKTATYTTERKQFDRPIGTFQAVGQRLAEAYIAHQAMELTMLQAATLLDELQPAADGTVAGRATAIAKYWAATGAHRIGHAALHVHGGISIDRDYPVHRHFRWLKQHELSLGGVAQQLDRLGRHLAAD